jgi:hypothetical protein
LLVHVKRGFSSQKKKKVHESGDAAR